MPVNRGRLAAAVLAVGAITLAGCGSAHRVGASAAPSPADTPPAASTVSSSATAARTVTQPPTHPRAPTTARAATPTQATTPPHTRIPTPGRTPTRTYLPPPVTVTGQPLVVLNPGHNGGNAAAASEIARPVPSGFGQTRACDTTGTETDAGYPEHAFNWDVALRVRAILSAHGVRVLLTRQNDTGVGPCIDARSAIGNYPQVAAAFVSIHADGAPESGHGFHICEDALQPAGPAVAAQSHRLTVDVHDALVPSSGLVPSTYLGNDGYDPRTDFAGLNLARGPATFIELGNMRNPGDAALQSSPGGRQQIADSIAAGILAFVA